MSSLPPERRGRRRRRCRSAALAVLTMPRHCGCIAAMMAMAIVLLLAINPCRSFSPTFLPSRSSPAAPGRNRPRFHLPRLSAEGEGAKRGGGKGGEKDGEEESWDSDVDYENEFPGDGGAGKVSPDPGLDWNVPKAVDDADAAIPKLGIDIGSQLEPLSKEEAAELKAAATEIINDAVAEGIDEIEKLRARMRRELEAKSKAMQFASELNAQRESERLLGRIDQLTESFLKDTKMSRAATKLASSADRNMEGRGVEMGVWGEVAGASVETEAAAGGGSAALLGSVAAAAASRARTTPSGQDDGSPEGLPARKVPRIVVVADTKQDNHAKKIVPPLVEALEGSVPDLEVSVFSPTATLPLGGNDAGCAVIFATSLSDKSSVANALDRLLRRTLQAGSGAIGEPPTQVVLVSTVGTERTNKMPYSFQNMMGGKLEKRRQMEETVIRIVRDRVVEPPLDFTVCKLGSEVSDKESSAFSLMPGDCLDGNTNVNAAVEVLKEAIAFQPLARNATMCCVGSMQGGGMPREELDDWFLRLDGPEVWRETLRKGGAGDFDVLVEYMRGWGELLADNKKLITPIRTDLSLPPRRLPTGVSRQEGVKLLFLPTATGKNYMSREEEKALDRDGSKTSTQVKRNLSSLFKKEGGIEVLVEDMAKDGSLRVRAKRCNYGDDAVIKELSEETILKRLEDSLETWMKDHA